MMSQLFPATLCLEDGGPGLHHQERGEVVRVPDGRAVRQDSDDLRPHRHAQLLNASDHSVRYE